MVDDLEQPLKQRKKLGFAGASSPKSRKVMFGLAAASVVMLGGAMLFFADPRSAEPTATAEIDSNAPQAERTKISGLDNKPQAENLDEGTKQARETAAAAPTTANNNNRDIKVGQNAVIRQLEQPLEQKPISAPAAATPLASVDPEMNERSKYGALPRIGPDGRKPVEVYSRKSTIKGAAKPGEPPRVAVMINGLGLSAATTDTAIRKLPPDISLAFAPYGANLKSWVDRARQDGHEVFLQVPLEPFDYPQNDPGPHTLLTGLPPEANIDRLHWLMSRFQGFVGLTNYMGARFSASAEAMLPIFNEANRRGLIYSDDGTAPRSVARRIAKDTDVPFGLADVILDTIPSGEAIDGALAKLESVALEKGLAMGVGSALPVTIDRVEAWVSSLKGRGIIIIPVSAAIQPPKVDTAQ